jgi:valyl-tRNA synthetase
VLGPQIHYVAFVLWLNKGKKMKELPKRFEFQDQEKIYKLWEDGGHFTPKVDKEKDPFTIIMPPPNANGALHAGHAVFVTLEDIMTRYNRMRGKEALWLPGADHAGFETQIVYEKKLEKEGRNRFEIDREQLYKETLDFTLKNKDVMENQLKKLGASCDWSREKFTLDPGVIKVVYQTFKSLYDDGLVYRDVRPVNWCPKHQTALSDLEVKYEEQGDPLYYVKYGPLTLATVRPETNFGDTALAVNPKDVGKEIEIETLLGKSKIKVIADEYVDPKFGTGVVKITPAHDPNDFEVSKRHPEVGELKIAIDQYGKLTELAGPYAGLKVREAREKIVADMKKKGLIEKVDENYRHSVGKCYKCSGTIEPRVIPQWYVAVNKKGESGKNLAADAIKSVRDGKIKFVPKRYEKIYYHWMENIRDWNISRQIVWGIQIPAWYCECGETVVATEPPKECPSCHSANLTQDRDVFDTWFSSGQWPFATLANANKGDFDYFYPTDVMETAADILFFWVARMIMLGIYVTDKEPFHTVVLHGLVRDKDRKKMSKSKGNVLDPLGIVEDFGADALRMALVFGSGVESDVIISEEKIRGFRNFSTKIWNAARFILSTIEEDTNKLDPKNLPLTKEDRWILDELKTTVEKTTKALDHYRFHHAAELIYDFFWHKLCDKCIEDSKTRLYSDKATKSEKDAARYVLLKTLTESLKLLHPFMPFTTEAIWQHMNQEKPLIISDWPK